MKGLLVYKREDALINRRFIELSFSAAEKHGLFLRLAYAEEFVSSPLPQADFALLRTRDASLSRRFEREHIRVFNSSYLNETANNKMLTYSRLCDLVRVLPSLDVSGQASPPFLPCVLKGAGGHGGEKVQLAYDIASYNAARLSILPDIVLAQPLVDPGRDLRMYVIGGEVVCAMLRSSSVDFRSNYKLGGTARQVTPSEKELSIARAVSRSIPIDYAGVDVIYDHGEPLLNEIEDPVGARMVYENTDVELVDLLFAHIRRSLS